MVHLHGRNPFYMKQISRDPQLLLARNNTSVSEVRRITSGCVSSTEKHLNWSHIPGYLVNASPEIKHFLSFYSVPKTQLTLLNAALCSPASCSLCPPATGCWAGCVQCVSRVLVTRNSSHPMPKTVLKRVRVTFFPGILWVKELLGIPAGLGVNFTALNCLCFLYFGHNASPSVVFVVYSLFTLLLLLWLVACLLQPPV